MLTVIDGYAQLALERVDPSEPLHTDLQQIKKAAQRSVELTRQLLAFARKQIVAPRVLDLNHTLAGMLEMLHRLIGEDIELAWVPRADLWPVKIDPAQIDQILANLCINARDAIAGVGKITIETGNVTFDDAYCAAHVGLVPGAYVVLAVSDNGCGMQKEVLEHIFEPFFTTKSVGEGTGLGLATVYGIVKQNSGFVDVWSEPGKGTTVKIHLPRLAGQTAESRAVLAAETLKGHGEVVLVVEDEATVMRLVKRMLQNLGYGVLTAGSPKEALSLVETHTGPIHVLLTDVVMPGMNGRDLATRITALKPDVKCVFMSGHTVNVIAHRSVLEDGVHFLEKPFSAQNLAIRVREALGKA